MRRGLNARRDAEKNSACDEVTKVEKRPATTELVERGGGREHNQQKGQDHRPPFVRLGWFYGPKKEGLTFEPTDNAGR